MERIANMQLELNPLHKPVVSKDVDFFTNKFQKLTPGFTREEERQFSSWMDVNFEGVETFMAARSNMASVRLKKLFSDSNIRTFIENEMTGGGERRTVSDMIKNVQSNVMQSANRALIEQERIQRIRTLRYQCETYYEERIGPIIDYHREWMRKSIEALEIGERRYFQFRDSISHERSPWGAYYHYRHIDSYIMGVSDGVASNNWERANLKLASYLKVKQITLSASNPRYEWTLLRTLLASFEDLFPVRWRMHLMEGRDRMRQRLVRDHRFYDEFAVSIEKPIGENSVRSGKAQEGAEDLTTSTAFTHDAGAEPRKRTQTAADDFTPHSKAVTLAVVASAAIRIAHRRKSEGSLEEGVTKKLSFENVFEKESETVGNGTVHAATATATSNTSSTTAASSATARAAKVDEQGLDSAQIDTPASVKSRSRSGTEYSETSTDVSFGEESEIQRGDDVSPADVAMSPSWYSGVAWGHNERILSLLEEEDKIPISQPYNCSRVAGLESVSGMALLCRTALYIVDNYTFTDENVIKECDDKGNVVDEREGSPSDAKVQRRFKLRVRNPAWTETQAVATGWEAPEEYIPKSSSKQVTRPAVILDEYVADMGKLGGESTNPVASKGTKQKSKNSGLQLQRGNFIRIPYNRIREFHRRNYLFRPVGSEFFDTEGLTWFVVFANRECRESVFKTIFERPLEKCVLKTRQLGKDNVGTMAAAAMSTPQHSMKRNGKRGVRGRVLAPWRRFREAITQIWLDGKITNFAYIMYLNTLAGRSFNDLTQYPVFPWVIAINSLKDAKRAGVAVDVYESVSPTEGKPTRWFQLNLDDPRSYRDLSKPMGAIGHGRARQYKERYDQLKNDHEVWGDDVPKPFFYGTHYSCSGYVLGYLVRLAPFTKMAIQLQGGQFDKADRLFSSVAKCWESAAGLNPNDTASLQDVRELTPEFFFMPEFLQNSGNYELGQKQDGTIIHGVRLPEWANGSPHEFVRVNRKALESRFVSEHLHEWVDLVFGYKQRGQQAEDACNLFHPVSYEGEVDIDDIEDPVLRESTICQIHNFGQTPTQLFFEPHPKRNVYVKVQGSRQASRSRQNDQLLPSSTRTSFASTSSFGLGGGMRSRSGSESSGGSGPVGTGRRDGRAGSMAGSIWSSHRPRASASALQAPLTLSIPGSFSDSQGSMDEFSSAYSMFAGGASAGVADATFLRQQRNDDRGKRRAETSSGRFQSVHFPVDLQTRGNGQSTKAIISLIGNALQFSSSQGLLARNSMVFTDAACSGVLGADVGFDFARSATAQALNQRNAVVQNDASQIREAIARFSGCMKIADLRFSLDNEMQVGLGLGFGYSTEMATSVKAVAEADGNAYFLPPHFGDFVTWGRADGSITFHSHSKLRNFAPPTPSPSSSWTLSTGSDSIGSGASGPGSKLAATSYQRKLHSGGAVTAVCATEDGEFLVTGGNDCIVKTWVLKRLFGEEFTFPDFTKLLFRVI